MRVISQDGTMDVPYEISSFSMAVGKYENVEHAVIFCYNYSTSMGTKMAEYGSKEKAKKAMEMLRERHTDNVFCREDIQYKAEIMLDEGLDIVREMMMKCEYFRFPKDDEVKA